MRKDLPTPLVTAIVVLVAVIAIVLVAYLVFRPEPTVYKPELLKGKRGQPRDQR